MVQIPGKYKLAENKNFYEFLLAVGLPDDKAKEGNEIKGTLEVAIDGKNITMTNDSPSYVTKLTVGEEVEETIGADRVLKSTAALSGDAITVTSKTKEGDSAGSRTFAFTDAGLEVTINAPKDGKTVSATRIYKRV